MFRNKSLASQKEGSHPLRVDMVLHHVPDATSKSHKLVWLIPDRHNSLKINSIKCKIVVFGRHTQVLEWIALSNSIQHVNSFYYLGGLVTSLSQGANQIAVPLKIRHDTEIFQAGILWFQNVLGPNTFFHTQKTVFIKFSSRLMN